MLQPTVADPAIGEATLRRRVVHASGHGQTLEGAIAYARELQALVRWFAMQYPTEPEWHFQNQFGQALPAAEELAATYRGVIG